MRGLQNKYHSRHACKILTQILYLRMEQMLEESSDEVNFIPEEVKERDKAF
jgi:hypothetical protein